MSSTDSPNPLVNFCVRNRFLILWPTAICAVLGLAYALTATRYWHASQTLVIRDDLLGSSFKPGRFPSQENLKNAQETLLHIAKKSEVIRSALRATYPEQAASETWPSLDKVDGTRDYIRIEAPNGAEFGKTDVVLLNVKQPNPEHARAFAVNLSHQIEQHVRLFRADVLRSMESELRLQFEQARTEYQAITEQVNGMVQTAGADLESLKSYMVNQSGSSELQRMLTQVSGELLKAKNEAEQAQKQIDLLRGVQLEGSLATNQELLQLQPTLKRLYDGWIDAKLKFSQDSGKYKPGHPSYVNSANAMEDTKRLIVEEIAAIAQGLENQKELASERISFYAQEEQRLENRLLAVNQLVVDYQTLMNDFTKRSEALAQLQTKLAEIKSLADSADQVSLVSIVGPPEVANSPSGLSKSLIILAGLLGGLAIGVAVAVILNDPKLSGYTHAAWETVREFGVVLRLPEIPALPRFRATPPVRRKTTLESVRPFGSGTASPSVRPVKLAKSADGNTGSTQRGESTSPVSPSQVVKAPAVNESASMASPAANLPGTSAVKPVSAAALRGESSGKLTPEVSAAAQPQITPTPSLAEESLPREMRLENLRESLSRGRGPAVEPLEELVERERSWDSSLASIDQDSGHDPTANVPRNSADTTYEQMPEQTLDLQELQRLLNGRLGIVDAGSPAVRRDNSNERAESIPEPETGAWVEPTSEAGRKQKALKDRLNMLSSSITAFCEPVKRDESSPPPTGT